MFDPASFLETTVTDANDTKLVPVPVGEFTAIIEKVEARQWQSRDGAKSGISLDITWAIDDQSVKELLGREKVTVRQSVMLDTTEQGALDVGKGKNIQLGRLREAVDLNTPGTPFAFSALPGRVAKVKVSHRLVDEDIFSEVKGVTKLN